MKINFNELLIKTIDGKDQKVSISNELGNILYMRGKDITECELGRSIYNDGKANVATELDEKQQAVVKEYIGAYPYVVRQAVGTMMKNNG